VNQREPRLITQRVEAPDLGNVDLVLRGQPSGHLDRSGWDIQMERRAGSSQVGPLRHGLEMVHRLGCLDLDGSRQLVRSISGCKYKIREDLHLSDSNGHGLRVANVCHHLALALQAHQEEPDDAIVLELLAHGADEDGAHWTSRSFRLEAKAQTDGFRLKAEATAKEKNQLFGSCTTAQL
jgi:hypothetical protein